MRPRSLLVLLAVVLALGAFIWFFERELPGTEEREEMAKLLLPRLETGEVTALAVEHGGETVRLERVETAGEAEAAEDEAEAADDAAGELPADVPPPAEWRIAAPERFAGARADRVAVESLVSALAALEKSRTLDDFDRAALGLDPPRARVTLERADGEPIVVAVGADLPASSDMVVLREDQGEAHVVDRAVLHDLTRAAGDWRARETFPGERDDVERVRLAGGGGEVVLERAGGGFRLTRPVADAADPAAVDELLGALTRLTAERFVDAPGASPAELGLAPPAATLTVELAGGRPPVVIEIGAPRPEGDGHTYRVGGQLFVAESALPETVARPAAAWRSPALTSLELYRVDRVTIDGPDAGGRLELVRSGTDWQRGGQTIAYTPVSDLLFTLVEAKAEEIVPRGAARPGPAELTVELAAGGAEGEEPERQTIAFHPAAEGLVPVTVSGRDVVLRVPEEAVAGLRAHLAEVRAAEPVAAGDDGEAVPEGIEVEREEGF